MFADCRKVLVAAVLIAALGAAQAQQAQQAQQAKAQARAGAVADGVSSVAVIAAGAPLSPLLPVLGVALKAATFQHAESLPETDRPHAYALAAAGWQGSAAVNACAAASVLSGGSFLPVCLMVGATWGWKTWEASEGERRDAATCAARRASARNPKLRCPLVRQRTEQAATPRRRAVAAKHPPRTTYIEQGGNARSIAHPRPAELP